MDKDGKRKEVAACAPKCRKWTREILSLYEIIEHKDNSSILKLKKFYLLWVDGELLFKLPNFNILCEMMKELHKVNPNYEFNQKFYNLKLEGLW